MELTHSTKMGADSSKLPKCTNNIYLHNFSAQAQKIGIAMKKVFIGCSHSVAVIDQTENW